MAPRILAILTLSILGLSACATAPDPAPLAGGEARADRVVVAPLNLAIRAPAELAGAGDPVWQELLRTLQERDRQVAVVSPITAERMWLEVMLAEEQATGQPTHETATAGFARSLAEHRDFDLLVLPSLVLRKARVNGYTAHWDGVRHTVPMDAPAPDLGLQEVFGNETSVWVNGVRGSIGAVSLHLQVLRPDGALAHEGMGGLEVLQRAEREREDAASGWDFVLSDDLFADPASLLNGNETALERDPRRTAWAW